MPIDVNFMVGGEAGQGVQSVGFLLARALARGGYHVFADQDYESRIRGGHNFFRVRASDRKVAAIAGAVDMLIALNEKTIDLHRKELAEGGAVIFDSEKLKPGATGKMLSIPLERLAEEKGGGRLMANTVALGAALGITGYDFETLAGVLREYFKTAGVAENNMKAARAGYEYAQNNFKGVFTLARIGDTKRMLISGSEAIALGAIAAGCKLMAAYPMTPTTPIMEYMAARAEDMNLVMVHAEDEIAAINMAIGASFAGVRAMTATSGSGFCLMAEGLGLAGMTETPIVVIDGQRPGPAIGLPTRTEQGDLEFVLHAHHGDFPRAVLAPADIADSFWTTVKAFNLADRYQMPVIILTDHHLATSYATVERFDLSRVTVDRGQIFSREGVAPGEYLRHRLTRSGISPRAFPGEEGVLVVTDADEHDEAGHLTEDAATRTRQVQKRLRKLLGLKKEMSPPGQHGPKRAEITLIGWGSTAGAIKEAVDMLHGKGLSVNSLHLVELWPFPAEAVTDALSRTNNSYVIENNATGQLSRLIRTMTGKEPGGRILRYDGRPFTPALIAAEVEKGVC